MYLSRYLPALSRRGCIAPSHSLPRHYLGCVVNVTPRQRFTPGESTPGQEAGWASELVLDTEPRGKSFASARDRMSVVQSVVRRYTEAYPKIPIFSLIGGGGAEAIP
jgi:hypothetical protein